MGLYFGYPDPSCACNRATTAATLTLTVHGCSVSLLPTSASPLTVGLTISLTQGGTTVAAVTNSLGVATFSLPSTGVWTVTQSGAATGYLTAQGSLTLTAGANTKTLNLALDTASGYFCDGCGTPVLSLTVTVNPGANVETILLRPPFGVATDWFAAGVPGVGVLRWVRAIGVPAGTALPGTGFGIQDSGVPATSPKPAVGAGGFVYTWNCMISGSCFTYAFRYIDSPCGFAANYVGDYTH